ncbi:MAG TPA: cupin domain-containing protein [Verrucomicrobiaceae bacterium]|jgi:uncharacterized cupin superfamily protein
MQRVNLNDVPVEHRISPKGKFELYRQHVSLALGGKKDRGPWDGGHPFDIEMTRIPPGKANYPLHSHAAQTEHYIFLSGSGAMVTEGGAPLAIQAGDHVICHPGEAHQIVNDGTKDLVLYVIADHHRADVTTYSRTGKRHLKPEYRVVRTEDAGYYDGEE